MGGTYYQTSQEWLDQSMLLIQAQPTTTKIQTRYCIKKPKPPRIRPLPENPTSEDVARHERRKRLADKRKDAAARARLVLKTYDPVTGCCLKYRTTKAAEVGRLVSGMGMLGMGMAALPLEVAQEKKEAEEVAAGSSAAGAAAPSKEAAKEGQGGGKTGGKKKKKGKK